MDRRLCAVPRAIRWALVAAFVLQLAFAALQPPPRANAEALTSLPSAAVLRIASLGDPIVLAQLLTLYLQAFDNQPGVSIPFLQLDYARVENWLERILELDPQGQYPPLAAQVYALTSASAADAGVDRPAFLADLAVAGRGLPMPRSWPAIASRTRDRRCAMPRRCGPTPRLVVPPGRQMEIFLHGIGASTRPQGAARRVAGQRNGDRPA